MWVSFRVFGSETARWRDARWIGNSFADGCVEPAWHPSGSPAGRTTDVSHTRPCRSSIGLWTLLRLVQRTSSPQYGDGRGLPRGGGGGARSGPVRGAAPT